MRLDTLWLTTFFLPLPSPSFFSGQCQKRKKKKPTNQPTQPNKNRLVKSLRKGSVNPSNPKTSHPKLSRDPASSRSFAPLAKLRVQLIRNMYMHLLSTAHTQRNSSPRTLLSDIDKKPQHAKRKTEEDISQRDTSFAGKFCSFASWGTAKLVEMKPAHLRSIPSSRGNLREGKFPYLLLLVSSYPAATVAASSRSQLLIAAPRQLHQQSLHWAHKPAKQLLHLYPPIWWDLKETITSMLQAIPGRSSKVAVSRFMCLPASR